MTMPDTPEIPESDLWDLDAAYNAAMDALATNDRVYDATEKALRRSRGGFIQGWRTGSRSS